MATFGKTTQGVSSQLLAADKKFGCKFTIAESGTATKITAYLEVGNGKAMIYSDSGGAPNALLVTSSELGFGSPGWNDYTIADTNLIANTPYWLAVILNVGATYYYDVGAANQERENSDTYADGPSDPFGAGTDQAREVSIYCTYTPVGVGGMSAKSIRVPLEVVEMTGG